MALSEPRFHLDKNWLCSNNNKEHVKKVKVSSYILEVLLCVCEDRLMRAAIVGLGLNN